MTKCKQMVTGLVLAAGLAIAPAISAHASPTEVLGFGADAGGAAATTTPQERGSKSARAGNGVWWYWGVGQNVWSHYLDNNRCHGATAIGKKERRVTGISAGRTAIAETPAKLSGNQAFYHTC